MLMCSGAHYIYIMYMRDSAIPICIMGGWAVRCSNIIECESYIPGVRFTFSHCHYTSRIVLQNMATLNAVSV